MLEGLGIEEWIKLTGASATALLGLWAFARKFCPWILEKGKDLFGYTQNHEELVAIVETLNCLTSKVNDIYKEIKPNGVGVCEKVDILSGKVTHINQMQYAVMDSRNEAIFKTDPDGNCTWVNRAYSRLTGRPLSELKGHGWVNVLHPDTREHDTQLWYDSVKEERPFEETVTMQDLEGNKILVSVHSHVLQGGQEHPSGYVGIVNKL